MPSLHAARRLRDSHSPQILGRPVKMSMESSGIRRYLGASAELLSQTAAELPEATVDAAIEAIVMSLEAGNSLLVCGNGGSAADAMHIVGELVGKFLIDRRAFKVVCLSCNPAVLTAWSNDVSYDTVFARQVEAYGERGGALLGLSTSGNSENVIEAFHAARAMDVVTIAMTGNGGGRLAQIADICLTVPSSSTPMIQQVHVCLYHYICERVEARLARDRA